MVSKIKRPAVDPAFYQERRPECELCPRAFGANHVCMWGRGNLQAKIMLVLDAPNSQADFQGALLDVNLRRWVFKILEVLDLKPGIDVYITYAVKCTGDKPNAKSIEACKGFLFAEINQVKPELVIGMGPATAKALLGKGALSIKKLRNRLFELVPNVRCGFTFSPRLLALEPGQIQTIVADIETLLGRKQHAKVELQYFQHTIPETRGSGVFGYDIETSGLVPFDPSQQWLTCAISDGLGRAYGLNVAHGDGVAPDVQHRQRDYINRMVDDPNNTLAGHSIKYDILWTEVRHDIDVKAKLFDTKVAYSLLDENAPDNSLKHLCATFTDLGHYADDINKKALASEPLGKVLEYNCQDADGSRRLVPVLTEKLQEQGLMPVFEFSMEAEKVLIEIERTGVWVDKPWAAKVGIDTWNQREEARTRLFQAAGKSFNLDAPQQVGEFLYDRLGLPVLERTKEGQPKTDKDTLIELTFLPRLSPFQTQGIGALNDFKKAHTLWKKYFSPLYGYLKFDGRIHTTYNIGRGQDNSGDGERGAVTGRLSSSNPNLQNIPISSSIRGMFAATGVTSNLRRNAVGVYEFDGTTHDDWQIITADYSQLELRVAAFVAQDRTFMEAFDQGLDPHTYTLADILGFEYKRVEEGLKDKGGKDYGSWKNKRVAVKRINFGVLYGIGYRKLTRQLRALGVQMREDEVRDFMERWFAKHPAVVAWIGKTEEEAISKGQIRTPFGRIRRLVGASRKTEVGAGLLRQAVNTPIQATASEICLVAMIHLHAKFKTMGRDEARLLLQVHDMLGAEFNTKFVAPDVMRTTFKKCMESDVLDYMRERFKVKWNVPLEVDIDINERWS